MSRFLFIVLTALLAGFSSAMWANSNREKLPVGRVIANLSERMKDKPDEGQRFAYARACSFAFAYPDAIYEEWGPSQVKNTEYQKRAQPDGLSRYYLQESISTYEALVQDFPKNGQYWLGLGYTLELAGPEAQFMPNIKVRGRVLSTANLYRKESVAAYRECFSIGLVSDFKDNSAGSGVETDWLCKESGERIMELIDTHKADTYQSGEREKIEDAIKRSDSRQQWITPILFPVDRSRPLSDLINLEAKTSFDLKGDSAKRTWSWITSRAAWLVWDPDETGQITSGRQLFGSATWWMFFRDGYSALAALDNDHDGWLKGKELRGIAAWQDRNGNAMSDAGEVVPVEKWGIAGIKTRFDRRDSAALTSDQGILLKNGKMLPSYDWFPVGTNRRL
jgi:hypothetical protein